MSSTQPKRKRADRVANVKLPPGTIQKAWGTLRRGDVLARVALCLLAGALLWGATFGWRPAMPYREGDVPTRNVVARVSFERRDEQATLEAQKIARSRVDAVYVNDPRPVRKIQQALKDKVFQLLAAASYEEVDKAAWGEFASSDNEGAQVLINDINTLASLGAGAVQYGIGPPLQVRVAVPKSKLWLKRYEFARFKASFADDPDLAKFEEAIRICFIEIVEHGLFESLQHEPDEGNLTQIRVSRSDESVMQPYLVDQVRIAQAAPLLQDRLAAQLASQELADKVFAWLKPRLPTTLTFDPDLTDDRADEAIRNLPPVMIGSKANESVLARAGEPITPAVLRLLEMEHEEYVSRFGLHKSVLYSLANFGLYIAISVLCGSYLYFRRNPLIHDLNRLSKLLLLSLATVIVSYHAAPNGFELIPLLLFSMTAAILYKQELALLFSACVVVLTDISLGFGLPVLVTHMSGMTAALLALRHVRSRTKLLYVAMWAALVSTLTSLGASILSGHYADISLLQHSLWLGACAIAAGLLMTGLLPFIERFFEVQTDLSLLELGDVAHPLLQELVRRAPGTYNHSINVASIAQAAAESIGANGLLVRVGAYFHDIGKMLKPSYFVENQSGDNCHESLLPAMSTLVIIAHVKDGADLARQHNLPSSIIDFIQQHHGTTLVEYFYRRANEQKESDPEAATVDEGSYRYPGPKPQTREAAVLMLSDTVESACRSLVDPAPARIESLVDELAMKRLMDGQFDQCGLTLRELRIVQDSLIKSLTAVYHGRIKYPGQQSA